MKVKLTLERKYRILLALHKLAQEQGGDIHTFAWRLGTGRLPGKVEWAVMKALGASTIGDAVNIVGNYMENWAYIARHDLAELREKGYITPRDEQTAKRFLPVTMPHYQTAQ